MKPNRVGHLIEILPSQGNGDAEHFPAAAEPLHVPHKHFVHTFPPAGIGIPTVPFHAEHRDQVPVVCETRYVVIIEQHAVGKDREDDVLLPACSIQDLWPHQRFTSRDHDHTCSQL
jgi:hypothetical protein